MQNMHVKKYQRVTTEGISDNLYISMEFQYVGDSNISIALPAGVKVGVKQIQIVGGPMIMEMSKMLPAPPFFSGIQIYFVNAPSVDLKWSGAAGMIDATRGGSPGKGRMEKETAGLFSGIDPTSHLRQWLQSTIEGALCGTVVYPNGIAYLMNKEINPFEVKTPMPASIFEFQLLKGRNLPIGDWTLTGGSSDPFCTVRIGGTTWTSETITANLNPEWNDASHDFFMDPHIEENVIVHIDVYDQDFLPGGSPDFLGNVLIPLQILLDNSEPRWFKLTVPKSLGGPSGPGRKPSELLLFGRKHPVLLDHDLAQTIRPHPKRACYLLFCGIVAVDHMDYVAIKEKEDEPKMTVIVDTVYKDHKESTGVREVSKPPVVEPEESGSEDENSQSKPKTDSDGATCTTLEKATISLEYSYIWPVFDLDDEVAITLTINGQSLKTCKTAVRSLLQQEKLTDDSKIPMNLNEKSHHHNLLSRRLQLRVIQR